MVTEEPRKTMFLPLRGLFGTFSRFSGLYLPLKLPPFSRPNTRMSTITAITARTISSMVRPYSITPLVQYSLHTCFVTPNAEATAVKIGSSKDE